MMATKHSQPQATPSTVASTESSGLPRKYSWMSSGSNSIASNSSNMYYYQSTKCPSTPRNGNIPNNYNNLSCPTTPVSHPNYDSFPSPTPPGINPNALSIAPRSPPNASKENHYYSANRNNITQPLLKQMNTQNQQPHGGKSINRETNQRPLSNTDATGTEGPVSPSRPSKAEFSKSQADLNRSYWQRRAKYNKLPIAAKVVTGRNLKNLRPLAIRTAEFC